MLVYATLIILLVAISAQVSLQVALDITVSTVNDIALKSQVDDNIICSDEAFRPIFANSVLARPASFRYKRDPTNFLFYTFIVS